ncbi:MAG: PaaI family thioesterase [Chloroflexota bacterium]|nr:PaaI family thioesterase [Chloroflexota bacterium]
MHHHVRAKQPNSEMCMVCGIENPFGLGASFYELDNDELLGIFHPAQEHQGYPGRLHGGLAAAILDETMGRAISVINEGDIWGVSVKLTTRFRKPIPLDEDIRAVARITKDSKRFFEGTGEILLSDGSIAVEGCGRYLKSSLNRIISLDVNLLWKVISTADDPLEVEF